METTPNLPEYKTNWEAIWAALSPSSLREILISLKEDILGGALGDVHWCTQANAYIALGDELPTWSSFVGWYCDQYYESEDSDGEPAKERRYSPDMHLYYKS